MLRGGQSLIWFALIAMASLAGTAGAAAPAAAVTSSASPATASPATASPAAAHLADAHPRSARGIQPTPGAVSVGAFGASGAGTEDDTGAFGAAMAAALSPGAVRYAAGPGGAAQGVVYVPAGTYRLLNLTFPSNLRMEVDAGAVLEQAGGRTATSPPGYSSSDPSIVLWDGPGGAPLTNVSLVGVGSATGGAKTLAGAVAPGWSIDNDFTLDLDPQATNANNLVSGLMAMNVKGFLVANVFSVQNDFDPLTTPPTAAGWWPSSRKAAFGLRARSDSPANRSVFYDPQNGTITNWYNVDSPPGFGPDQIDSAQNIALSNIFSRGGTTLRFETDNSNQVKFGSELNSITADNVVGVNCNRAVSFAPHFQTNYGVRVTQVQATDCYQGILESADKGIPAAKRGAFFNSTVSGVTVVGGTGAQVPVLNTGRWTIGSSYQAFGRDKANTWAVVYTPSNLACQGSFQKSSNPVETTAGFLRPKCTS